MADAAGYGSKDTDMRSFIFVWIIAVVLNLVEILFAFKVQSTKPLLALLATLAVINAGLILGYFMHLKYEQRRLVFTLIPALLFVLLMMVEMVPDSVRLHNMRPHIELDQEQPQAAQQ